ncbi:MAG: DUF433 domain-containing protein [Alphaproteobacteria bacterium]|nr:DUF433 domain-containing protein [Alphaproteobacteria bacterium]MBU1516987.1 DUF433 domain-containing protein [Alphaproteobacteria bacterium]MBU2094975.1 DUF433 domain-containing protein [Alphaproteobacteria bacterium]MBU2152528.1 DUF433 domain-containing protein [Alphaproteobacteria bacterium]MBU2308646.1 DUF433 domain-containing protein [Alphaproteobacteria bacterium]
MTEVIGAFSEEQAAQLANVSRHQLREWDRRGLLKPSYGTSESYVPYGRIYSFRDLVSARVLGQLRKHGVSFSHLAEVHKKLSALSEAPWASTVLWVCGREVVVAPQGAKYRQKLLSGQEIFDIPLKIAISSVRNDLAKLNERAGAKVGKIDRERFVAQGQYVVKGTRIPVRLIASFAKAGYTVEQIIREYPELAPADVVAALSFEGVAAA